MFSTWSRVSPGIRSWFPSAPSTIFGDQRPFPLKEERGARREPSESDRPGALDKPRRICRILPASSAQTLATHTAYQGSVQRLASPYFSDIPMARHVASGGVVIFCITNTKCALLRVCAPTAGYGIVADKRSRRLTQ